MPPPTILSLPNELLLAIAESLSPSELLYIHHTNKRLNYLFRDLFIDALISEDGPHGALFWAIALKDQDLVETVLQRCQKGVHVVVDHLAVEPPLPACGEDKRLVKYIMDLNVALEVQEGDVTIGPLMWAARNRRARLARMLLASGFHIDTDDWGYPRHLSQEEPYKSMLDEALLEACKLGCEDMVRVMLEPGMDTDIEVVGADGLRPLQKAVVGNHLGTVGFLLTRGANVEACEYKWVEPYCAIDMAIKMDRAAMWKLMLNHVNAEFWDYQKRPALLLAAATGDLALVQYLLDKGVFLARADCNGRTALHMAAKKGWADICELLVEEGMDTEARDHTSRTALHEAASGGPEAISALLDGGAVVNVADFCGRTPLHLAARNEFATLDDVQALRDAGADMDVKDARGRTPRGGPGGNVNTQKAQSDDETLVLRSYLGVSYVQSFILRLSRSPVRRKRGGGSFPMMPDLPVADNNVAPAPSLLFFTLFVFLYLILDKIDGSYPYPSMPLALNRKGIVSEFWAI